MALEQIGGSAAPATPPAVAPNTRARSAESQVPLITGSKAAQPSAAAPSLAEVRDAVKKIEKTITPEAQGLRFSIDQDTGITVIKLIDTQTQTVLRQMPTVEVIEISKALDKLQGLLVKEKA